MRLRLSEINVHPVKSCRRVVLDQVAITETGLAHDRIWQVVDATGAALTQRQHRVLATVQPRIVDGGITITAEGRDDVFVADPSTTDVTVRSLGGAPVRAADGGDDAADWFSELIGAPCRIAGITADSDQRLPPSLGLWDQPFAFTDAAPVLLANTASLSWLVDRASAPFGMDRFRPNLIIDTYDPWVEDTWRTLTIGSAHIEARVPWPRCAIPQIDQVTGERHAEPAKVLRAHRWCDSAPDLPDATRSIIEGNALFGVAATIGPPGTTVSVGDEVVIGSTGDPLIAAPS